MGILDSLRWVVMERMAGERGMGQRDEGWRRDGRWFARSGLDETEMATDGYRCVQRMREDVKGTEREGDAEGKGVLREMQKGF
ncbi:hypothetical protein AAC387_Pa03g4297 [Persea americana]